VFVTVFLAVKYLFVPFQTPGWSSVLLLDDRTFLLTCSMTLMALVAVAQWDALSLDARDASVLGTLPVPHGLLVRAKLAALVLFGVGFALGLSIIPAVVHPALSGARLDIQIVDGLRLMAAHAATNLAAGSFGFLTVLALRETMRALIGQGLFRRVSAVLQASLVLILVTVFLLAPALSSGVAGVAGRAGAAAVTDVPGVGVNAAGVNWSPPHWFLGLQQTIAGDAIDRLPREKLPLRIMRAENEATRVYRRVEPRFGEWGATAVIALASVAALAFGAFLWNSRKLPAPVMARRSARGVRLRAALGLDRPVHTAARFLAGGDPVARAGFLAGAERIASRDHDGLGRRRRGRRRGDAARRRPGSYCARRDVSLRRRRRRRWSRGRGHRRARGSDPVDRGGAVWPPPRAARARGVARELGPAARVAA
jgi:hypothetical protein